ncbi:MAG TPA: SpoIID/LytB domain-containing protein [Baekduia sp.]|nr:SpoIID/LytB domain-containing protein [Baekduia sp.]
MRRIAAASVLTLAAAVLAAAAAPGAHAASRLVVKGHGYGHGIGMSQYGALGFAQHGTGYKDILGHYYEDTNVVPLQDPPDVRVLLQSGKRAVVSGVVAAGSRKLKATSTYSVRAASGGRVALYSATGRRMGTYGAPLRLAAPKGGAFTLRGPAANGTRDGRYRGAVEVRPSGSGVQAINALGLEDYVRGVVSAESPSSWPAEALKAQAVAARSYAVTSNVGTTTDGIDQYADTRSQMYKGVAAEFPSTDAAVAATNDEVVAQNGKAVTTFFFSTSGGHTENIEDSFIGSLPRSWLKGVDDPYDSVSPRHNWGPFTFSQSRVQAKLKGLVRGSFRGITVLERGASPRIVRAEVDGTNGVTQVTGPQLRQRFGLFDTWATFTYISSNAKQKSSDDDAAAEDDGSSTTTPASTTSPSSGGVTTPDADATGGQAASIARLLPQQLAGTIRPAQRGRRLAVQRHDASGWRTVGHARVGRGGRYRATLPGPGAYRVALGDVAGPTVNVR